ncbi:tetratricopeptide repeat protein [Actinomadura madurae]|uniref:tetratricopeptide repeat protein n=1 Tax=Actinomadura madurae TaxID=1993 RepID=UPI003D6B3975
MREHGVRCPRQRSNRFGDAEKHLSRAVALEPGGSSAQRLAECYVRQDRFERAIPLLQSTDSSRDKAYADLFPTSAAHRGGSAGRRARTCPSSPWIPCLPSKPP